MSTIVYIAFQGGTHGNYLRFCIDKFSTLTPPLDGTPFTENNTSHQSLPYSGKIKRYHPTHSHPYFKDTDCPHILVTVDTQDILFLERWVTIRAGDLKVDTHKDVITFTQEFLERFPWQTKFKKYYNVDISKKSIPRFLMRDFYKLSFLDPGKNGFIDFNKVLLKNKPKDTFEFPVSHFWDINKFFSTLADADKDLSLGLDLSDTSIHKKFLSKLNFLNSKWRADDVVKNIENKKDVDISSLDTVEQAYISAWIEQNHDFVTVPLTNSFFSTTGEIIDWLEHYPQQYKAMNPNLPTFNNIPNPFHLWNIKK